MARSTADAIQISERLRKVGANLVSLSEKIDTTSAFGEFYFSLLAALAQLERQQISERTAMGMSYLKRNGKRHSRHAPFGFRHDDEGNLIEVTSEQEAIEIMRQLHDKGGSLREISSMLAKGGHFGRTGKPLGASVIRSILKRDCIRAL